MFHFLAFSLRFVFPSNLKDFKVKRSVGIEINDLPASYGAAMGEDFTK